MGHRQGFPPHHISLPPKILRIQGLKKKKNYLITIEKLEELLIDKEEMLEPHPHCCIYRVPKDLRNISEAAYTPKVISIGPLHHGKKEFEPMEKQKIRLKGEFRKRITTEKWQEIINFIKNNGRLIRNCYDELPEFVETEFVIMALNDAVFIIELFLRHSHKVRSEFLLAKPRVKTAIRLDLQLLENQIPFRILNGLYKLAFFDYRYPSFSHLSCSFFKNDMPYDIPPEVMHFTDLGRYILTRVHPNSQSKELPPNLPGAHKLQESGVKFKHVSGKCLLDLKLKKEKLIPCLKACKIPCRKICELQIPHIKIFDGTECLIRNVMALEQLHYPSQTHVCNYIHLLDTLVDTEEDVNCLIEAGVLSNYLGDNKRVANIFNDLCLQIVVSPSCYYEILKDLESHPGNSWNHTKEKLRSVYFSNLWRGTATFAAIMLLLLTLTQTICSILQVV